MFRQSTYIVSIIAIGASLHAAEFLIDTSVIYINAPHSQDDAAIAFDGTNYLVVWEDNRSATSWDIYGARVDQSGTALDPAGFSISTALSSQRFPTVAFDGTNYLVVWVDFRSDSAEIYGARIDPAGTLLDTTGIKISDTLAGRKKHPSISFNGTNYLVVWQDVRNITTTFYDIYGARVTPSGIVLDSANIQITNLLLNQERPVVVSDSVVASDTSGYFVLWEDWRTSHCRIYGARVTSSGIVLDSSGIPISTAAGCGELSATFGGNNYFVTWHDVRYGTPDVFGARVTPAGVVLDPSGILISSAAEYQWRPSVVFDGINYFVTWEDRRNLAITRSDVYCARVTQSGVVLDPSGIVISDTIDDQISPVVAFNGTDYLVVWEDSRNWQTSKYDIYGAKVTTNGVVLDTAGIAISTAAYHQNYYSATAFDNTNYLVVWADYRSDASWDIYGTRVDQTGAILDTSCIPIVIEAHDQYFPSIAFDGINYLVVWEDHRGDSSDIYGTRINQSGVVLDTAGILISDAPCDECYPSVNFDGTNYLVVWEDHNTGYYCWDIYGARVAPSGLVLDTSGIAISTADYAQYYPSIAFGNSNHFVVWFDERNSSYDIYGARISPGGVVLDPTGIALSTAVHSQRYPSVTFDGTNFFAVWYDSRNWFTSKYDIYGTRITPAGIVLDTAGIAISTAVDRQWFPNVVHNDTDYFVVWVDFRHDSIIPDIYGAQVDTTGIVIDSFAVSLQTGNQMYPALAHGTGDQILITYSGWTDSVNYHPANTMRIWGKLYPFVGMKEERSISVEDSRLHVYPNPFHDKTNIRYHIVSNSNTELKIYDATGRLVKEFTDFTPSQIIWKGTDDADRKLSSGVYFLQYKTEDYTETMKLLLIR